MCLAGSCKDRQVSVSTIKNQSWWQLATGSKAVAMAEEAPRMCGAGAGLKATRIKTKDDRPWIAWTYGTKSWRTDCQTLVNTSGRSNDDKNSIVVWIWQLAALEGEDGPKHKHRLKLGRPGRLPCHCYRAWQASFARRHAKLVILAAVIVRLFPLHCYRAFLGAAVHIPMTVNGCCLASRSDSCCYSDHHSYYSY